MRGAILAVAALIALASLLAGYALAHPVPARIGAAAPALHAAPVVIDGRVHGWFSRAPLHRGAVLLLPGVRANRLSMVRRARFLRDAGYSVLLIDFQATGESPGDAITFGWRERLDVLAAVDFLRRTLPNEPVAVVGSSLGGAAARRRCWPRRRCASTPW